MRRLLVVALLLLSSLALAQGPTKRPLTFEDMMALKRVAEPVLSPDGKWVVFSAVTVNLAENTRKPHIWIIPAAGGEARELITGTETEQRPRFSPDGKQLAYLSDEGGAPQIWVAQFDSGSGGVDNARVVTHVAGGVDGEIWAGNGNLVFTTQVYADCPEAQMLACTKERDEARDSSKVKAQIFTHLFYRHWSTWTYGKRSHIFVVPVAGGEPRDLTPGDYDAPVFSLGGQDNYAVSPDGKELAFTSNHDPVPADSTNNDIFLAPLDGSAAPRKVSVSPGSDSTPVYSPDGKWIAWRMQERAGYESDRFRLVVYDRASGKIDNLTENFDRWVDGVAWSPDSKTIYFTAENAGQEPIWAIPAAGGAPKPIIAGSGYDGDMMLSADGATMVFGRMTVAYPTEIFIAHGAFANACAAKLEHAPVEATGAAAGTKRVTPDESCTKIAASQLTHMNDAVFSRVQMSPVEPFWFTGAENARVEGFLLKPPDFDPQKKYPVKFLVHGGPQGAWGDDWSYRWNVNLFAANGYVVVMINPRGSTGYGQKFIDEINGDWGGRPFVDLMDGLDYAEKTFPYIDKTRECALGASYGGYMMDWFLGHTDRFKCIVSHDGMFDTISAYGTTEELWFPEWEFKGTPWTNRAMYEKWNPLNSVENFKTPTLVIHSQHDYRLDVSQGFELFTALQKMKVPSKMLYFPDESHFVLKPQNSQLWYKTVNDWVDQWTREAGSK
jgi:dipeptidyl aminopeptidase/acylaminoacyl peptidase